MELKLYSKLSPYINSLIKTKEAGGFKIHGALIQSYENLDTFIRTNNFDNGKITKELVEAWSIQRSSENLNSRNSRISVLRQLATYMFNLGEDVYLPHSFGSKERSKPYIPTRKELSDFFKAVDAFVPYSLNRVHLKRTYSILFRMYYFLGLRLNEPIMLKRTDYNYAEGTLYIRHSKGNKDRLVYLQDDFNQLLKEFDLFMDKEIFPNREWFFLRGNKGSNLVKTSMDRIFKSFWNQAFPDWQGKVPTPHCLRHAFVCHRINDWVEQGNNAEDLLPYLSRHLGHSSCSETFYYYHSLDVETYAFHNIIESNTTLAEETLKWLEK